MTGIFEDVPIYHGINGERASVMHNGVWLLIHAEDATAEEAVTIAMMPDQAVKLAEAIVTAANEAAPQ